MFYYIFYSIHTIYVYIEAIQCKLSLYLKKAGLASRNKRYTTKIKSTLYRLLLKIFSFSTCNYADQIMPLIQRTPTGSRWCS